MSPVPSKLKCTFIVVLVVAIVSHYSTPNIPALVSAVQCWENVYGYKITIAFMDFGFYFTSWSVGENKTVEIIEPHVSNIYF